MAFVYVLTNAAMPGLVKIGQTSGDQPDDRIGQLYTTGVPFPFNLEFACRVVNCCEVEQALHTAFAPYRVNPKREFFKIEAGQAIAILKLLHTEDATAQVAAEIKKDEENDKEVASAAAAGEQFRRSRRPNLDFVEMGIPVGSKLQNKARDNFVTVVGPRKVSLDGREMSLTAATQQVLGLPYAVQPGPYWQFEGKSLSSIYEETYPMEE